METSWLIMAALALAAAVFAVLMVRAQGANGFIRSELESARKQLAQVEEALAAKQDELDAAELEIGRLRNAAAPLGEPTLPRGVGDDEAGQAASSGPTHTIVRRPDAGGPVNSAGSALHTPAEAPRTMLYRPPAEDEQVDTTAGMPYLEIGDGDEAERHLLDFGKTSVGRDKGCDILIDDVAASRRHFDIIYDGRRFVIKDNDSTNGTLHNGARVEEAPLEFGDTIGVGAVKMVFSCEGYDLKDSDAARATELLEKCVSRQPDFLPALKILAFLLERDVGRKGEAAPLWQSIARLDS